MERITVPKVFRRSKLSEEEEKEVMSKQKRELDRELNRNEQLAKFHGLKTEDVSGLTPEEQSKLRAQMLDRQAGGTTEKEDILELEENDIEFLEEDEENKNHQQQKAT